MATALKTTDEPVIERIDRLQAELAEALAEWHDIIGMQHTFVAYTPSARTSGTPMLLNQREASEFAISPTLARVYRTGAQSVDDQLSELATQFKTDAMTIDPTIKGMWVVNDLTHPDRDSAFQAIYFERENAPFTSKPKAA